MIFKKNKKLKNNIKQINLILKSNIELINIIKMIFKKPNN